MRVGSLQEPGHRVLWLLLEQRPQDQVGSALRWLPRASASPLCPPHTGRYVSKHCNETHITKCDPCELGTFTAHANRETRCLPCAQCREGEWTVGGHGGPFAF